MRNVRILAALGLVAMAGVAQAEVTGTVTIVSDYDFRGITQTLEKPALQLSIDYGHESGFYAGVWGSNVDFSFDADLAGPSTEIDEYAGFKFSAGDLGFDVGGVYYSYPGFSSDLNFWELYGKVSWKIISGGVYYSTDFGATDETGIYVYADAGIPAGPVTIGLHAGHSDGDSIEVLYGPDSYEDYSIGLSYSASNLTLGIKWVTVDSDFGSDDRFLLSVGTALPWK